MNVHGAYWQVHLMMTMAAQVGYILLFLGLMSLRDSSASSQHLVSLPRQPGVGQLAIC